MITWQSWYRQPWRRPLPPRKKKRSVTPVTKILSYRTVFVGCVSFSSAGASFFHFFDKRRRHNVHLDRMIGSCFLMSFSLRGRKKKEYRHPPRYRLVPPRLRWQRQARNPRKRRRHCCCHLRSWNRPNNYFLRARYCPPSYPLTVSTG